MEKPKEVDVEPGHLHPHVCDRQHLVLAFHCLPAGARQGQSQMS